MTPKNIITGSIDDAMASEPKFRVAVLGIFLCLLIPSIDAQQTGKKTYTFRGKVEQVNTSPKPLTVTNEPVEGWMGTMTMPYAIDNAEVLSRVKVGDQITARVYEGDF